MMFLVIPVAFLVAISILVAVHEFGHYWVAKKLGFKVLRFSIGFGKPLITRVGKDADRTEYCLAAIPLGGYVRLLDEREGEVAAVGAASIFHAPSYFASHRRAAGGTCDESLVCIAAVRDIGDGRHRDRQAGGRSGAARQPGRHRRPAARRSNRCGSGSHNVSDTEELQIALIRQFSDEGLMPLRVRRDGIERPVLLRVTRRSAQR